MHSLTNLIYNQFYLQYTVWCYSYSYISCLKVRKMAKSVIFCKIYLIQPNFDISRNSKEKEKGSKRHSVENTLSKITKTVKA